MNLLKLLCLNCRTEKLQERLISQTIQNALLDLFCKIKLHEQIPKELYEGIVKPVHKDGNRECLNNASGITILSIVYKAIVIILEDQVMKYVENDDLLSEYQGAQIQ